MSIGNLHLVMSTDSTCFESPFCWADGDSIYVDESHLWRPFESRMITGVQTRPAETFQGPHFYFGWTQVSSPSGKSKARVQDTLLSGRMLEIELNDCGSPIRLQECLPGSIRYMAWNAAEMLAVLDSMGNVGIFVEGSQVQRIPAPLHWPERGCIELPSSLRWVDDHSSLVFTRGHHVFLVSLVRNTIRHALTLANDFSRSYVSGLRVSADGYFMALRTCALHDDRIVFSVHEVPRIANVKCMAFYCLRNFPAVLSFL